MNSMFIRLIYIILNVPLSSQLLPDPQDPPAFPKAPSLCWPPLPSDPSRKWRINLRPSNLSSQPITQPSVQRIRCPTGSLTPHTTSSRPSRCLFFFFFFSDCCKNYDPTPSETDLSRSAYPNFQTFEITSLIHAQCLNYPTVPSVHRSSVFTCCEHFVNGSPDCHSSLFCIIIPPSWILQDLHDLSQWCFENWCRSDCHSAVS